jgi:hypothetical protein
MYFRSVSFTMPQWPWGLTYGQNLRLAPSTHPFEACASPLWGSILRTWVTHIWGDLGWLHPSEDRASPLRSYAKYARLTPSGIAVHPFGAQIYTVESPTFGMIYARLLPSVLGQISSPHPFGARPSSLRASLLHTRVTHISIRFSIAWDITK